MYGNKHLRVQWTFPPSRFNPGVNTPTDLLKHGGFAAAAAVSASSTWRGRSNGGTSQRLAHLLTRTRVLFVHRNLQHPFGTKRAWQIPSSCGLFAAQLAPLTHPGRENHTAMVMETCSRVAITQRGQSRHVRSKDGPLDSVTDAVTRLPPADIC